MIVDSSAVLAVLFREPTADTVIPVLEAAASAGIAAPTAAETGIVLTARLGATGRSLLTRFLTEASIDVLPFTAEHWPHALDAYVRFGKGRHSAGLNFGDCLTYAIARATRQPLLCVGEDFPQTDLQIVDLTSPGQKDERP